MSVLRVSIDVSPGDDAEEIVLRLDELDNDMLTIELQGDAADQNRVMASLTAWDVDRLIDALVAFRKAMSDDVDEPENE